MTKAERIFTNTYSECRIMVKTHGFEGIGFGSLITEETTSTRTYNTIQKLIDKEKRNLELNRKLKVTSEERQELLENALEMVQITLNNSIRKEKEFKELMKA